MIWPTFRFGFKWHFGCVMDWDQPHPISHLHYGRSQIIRPALHLHFIFRYFGLNNRRHYLCLTTSHGRKPTIRIDISSEQVEDVKFKLGHWSTGNIELDIDISPPKEKKVNSATWVSGEENIVIPGNFYRKYSHQCYGYHQLVNKPQPSEEKNA